MATTAMVVSPLAAQSSPKNKRRLFAEARQNSLQKLSIIFDHSNKNRSANEEWRALWITSMNLESNLSKSACVCSLHFNQDDYITEAKKKLKPQAVTSVFPKVFPRSKKITVLSIKNLERQSSIQSSTSRDITQAGTFCDQGGSSSKYDVGISRELSYTFPLTLRTVLIILMVHLNTN